MRTWARGTDPSGRSATSANLDLDAVDELEVVELDGSGAWVARADDADAPSMPETAYRPARDGTGLAGLWQAIAER